MFHLVARSVRHRLLFHSMAEGVELLLRFEGLPVEAVCLMPDHLHLVLRRDARRQVAAILSGWARRCNAARGMAGPLVERLPDAEPLVDRQKVLRSIRYVHLNPCRAGLVADPLAWPLSTHRDAVGLMLRRIGPSRRAEWFHGYVSGDPSVAVDGSELPGGSFGAAPLWDVLAAVSAVTRTSLSRLKGPKTRALALRVGQELSGARPAEIAAALGCHRASLYRVPPVPRGDVARVQRVVGDGRFGAIDEVDLRASHAWRRYRWG